ncbi:MAG TPA: hypothetical protein VGH80_03565 [Xanthomonadaceae bacterium]|jgi:integrase
MSLHHPVQIGAAIVRAVDELADVDDESGAWSRPVADSRLPLDPAEAEAVGHWLSEFSRFPGTFDEYFDEAVRLMFWTTCVRRMSLSDMARRDALAYEVYLSTAKRGLSGERQRLAVQVAVGVYGALTEAGHIASSPWTKRMARGAARTRSTERLPSAAQWRGLHACVDSMAQTSLRERQHFERLRWVLRLLHHTGLSPSAAARVRTNDFFPRQGRWRLRAAEPGGAERDLPVSEQLMADFRRYRAFLGLSDESLTLDSAPAIRSISGKWHRFLTPTSIQLMVKGAFTCAATALQATDPVGAAELRRAYSCWLREAGSAGRPDATSGPGRP